MIGGGAAYRWLALDEINDFGVVDLGHVGDFDVHILLRVLLHRGLENGLIEGGLQLLIGEVDAELRKRGGRERW